MTEAVKGLSLAETETLFESFHQLLTGDPSVREKAAPTLGKLAVFEGVREFPVRVKCATLAWHTLRAALEEKNAPVSTE
jgi:nitrogen fixation NifU-like protein